MDEKSFKDLIEGVDSPLAENTDDFEQTPSAINVKQIKETKEPIQEGSNPVFIIDETNTTFIMDENTDETIISAEPAEVGTNESATLIQDKSTDKSRKKLSALQIVLICVVSIVALWTAIFTVDHTLAANGMSPLFCKQSAEYEDGSASYTGLGYKIQFTFNSNGTLTQKCVPIWKDGPNDIKTAQ